MKNVHILSIAWILYCIAIVAIHIVGLIPIITSLMNNNSRFHQSTIFIGIITTAFVLATSVNLIQFIFYWIFFKKTLLLRQWTLLLSFIVMIIYLLYYLIMMILDQQLHIQFPIMAIFLFIQFRLVKKWHENQN